MSASELSVRVSRAHDAILKRCLAVGDTPVATLHTTVEGIERRLRLKLEGANPSGSIKDRTAAALLADLPPERLTPGATVVESSSGNLAVAVGELLADTGVSFVSVTDPQISPVFTGRLAELGVRVEQVTAPDRFGAFLPHRLERVAALRRENPDWMWLNQYGNPAAVRVHQDTTGPEIARACGDDFDAMFVAVSTGGTLAGLARYFRAASLPPRIVAVDAIGSVVLSDQSGPRRLTGIGAGRKSDFLTRGHYAEGALVTDDEAFACCRALRDSTGVWVGGSSGAVVAAALRLMERRPTLTDVVCVCPDTGANYALTIYDDTWLLGQGIGLAPAMARYRALRFEIDWVPAELAIA